MRRPTLPQPRLRRLFSAWILAWLTSAAAAAPLAEAGDFTADARILRDKQVPLLVLFSRENCGWCEKVRREHLASLAADGGAGVVVREVHVDRDTPLTVFGGKTSTHRAFAQAHKAKLAPTLMFFGPDGEQLVEPIVGYRLPDFYGAFIDDALEDSRNRLRRPRP